MTSPETAVCNCCICREAQASVHLTRFEGAERQSADLCEACAQSEGVNEAAPDAVKIAALLRIAGEK